MEKYQPMSGYNMQMPYTATAPMSKPMTSAMPGSHSQPINVHASYEEINIYEQKKHPSYHQPHCHTAVAPCSTAGGWSSAYSILVLYILLVIILRSNWK